MFASVALATRIEAAEVSLTLAAGRLAAASQPGTQENALVRGFALLYVRAVLHKRAGAGSGRG